MSGCGAQVPDGWNKLRTRPVQAKASSHCQGGSRVNTLLAKRRPRGRDGVANLFQCGDLRLVQGVRELDFELDIQVPLVQREVFDGHAFVVDTAPAVGLDNLAGRSFHLEQTVTTARQNMTLTTKLEQPSAYGATMVSPRCAPKAQL